MLWSVGVWWGGGCKGWVLHCVLENTIELLSVFFTWGIIQFPVWFQRNHKINPDFKKIIQSSTQKNPNLFLFQENLKLEFWKWTQGFQGRKSEPSLLVLPLPHPPFLFYLLFLPHFFFHQPFSCQLLQKRKKDLHHISTLPLIKYNKILLKMVPNERARTQPSALARILVSDKGRVLRDRGITRVRRIKNPDNHQSCFMSWLHHWLPWCWISILQTT